MNHLKTFAAASLAMATFSGCQQNQKEPNVLFILVDDMQNDAIAALGNKDVYTPNIDGLIAEGITFTRTYTNGALCGALSMPSRAMLLTGRGIFEIQSDGMKIPDNQITFPEHFRANGYRTFATGKWHSDLASFNRSFEEGENIFFGGMHRYETNGHCSPCLHHYDSSAEYKKETAFIGEKFSSEMFADAAVDFLNSAKDDDRPFMAFVSFTSPHDPRNQLPDYGKKYKAENITLPDNFLPEHPFDNGELDIRDELVLPPPRTGAKMQEELALYYGMVSEVDVQIGRILRTLDAIGERDNTIIVFASDNGLAMGQNGLLGKQSLYEHSVGVPMLIIDPRAKMCGRQTEALCYLYDIYPTLCELTGLKIPTSVTGRSLKPVLEGKVGTHREDLFLIYSNQQRGLVKDRYKYIIYNVEGKITEQLFDLRNDPGELENLVEMEPDKVVTYKSLLVQRLKEYNDFCDLTTPLWWNDGHKLKWDELINLYLFEE